MSLNSEASPTKTLFFSHHIVWQHLSSLSFFYLCLFSILLPTWYAKAVVCYQFLQFLKEFFQGCWTPCYSFLVCKRDVVEELVPALVLLEAGSPCQPFPLRLWAGSATRGMLPGTPLFQELVSFQRKGLYSAGLDPWAYGLPPPAATRGSDPTFCYCESPIVQLPLSFV